MSTLPLSEPIINTVKMTAQQFLELGEDPPGVRLELVNGEIAVSPSANPNHSFIDTRLRRLLDEYVERHDLGQVFGDVDTIFGPHDVRRPDVIYFSKSRLHLVGRKAFEGPPDLCVEIISPSSTLIDRRDKYKLYEAAGVAHYWIIDPEPRRLEAFRLDQSAYVPAGAGQDADVVRLSPFPDLPIPLQRLWRPES
jgi:Uma2 family endonuclease